MAVVFQPDGKHLLGGGDDGIRRWRLSDGQEVAKQMGESVYAISVSRDGKWIACGSQGASVWDGELHEKVINVEGRTTVWTVDFSQDSTRFATGTGKSDNKMSIWSATTGERLVGPLRHNEDVTGTKFSPHGEHIATACLSGSICVFDSHNGDELIVIMIEAPSWGAITPLAWSNNGQQIFATSYDNKVRSFDASTGSPLAELEVEFLNDRHDVHSIALAPNGKFIATFVDRSISFLDVSTPSRIGPVIQDDAVIRSVTISQDSNYFAVGREDGKIVIRHLSKILADSYGPFYVSVCVFIVPACQTIPIPSAMAINYTGIYLR